MPKITVLPHAELCPEGKIIETAPSGETSCDVLLDNGIEMLAKNLAPAPLAM